MSILEVRGLQKIYTARFGGNKVEALKNVTFSVEEGEYVAIMGESGSGKTTLLNILAALDKPTSGTVLLDGNDVTRIKESAIAAFRRDNLGFVFQDFNLLDTFSLEDNIYLPLVLAQKTYQEMAQRLKPVASELGITDILRKYPYEVSGGQKQRAAVARALITNPKLILADEPTGALDSKSTDELLRLFSQINKGGQTILMVTHSVKAASHASRVLFIKDGEVFHQIYRGQCSDQELYQKISDTLTMNYIIAFLTFSDSLSGMIGGEQIKTMLNLGCYVIGTFSVIFLFYTNSFLIKKRKKELGLYNILGMGKKNIGLIIFWETVIIGVVAMLAGLAGGIIFSKLAELIAVNMLKGGIDYTFTISLKAISETAVLFTSIFVLVFLNSIRQVHTANPVELINSVNVGEKPPKSNWAVGLLGAVILAAAYYIAVTIKNPIATILWFFVAVIMVIVATNMLFISGSVQMCKILKKNKGYYYKANHFVSVSSMAYRMKRNGAGLAQICILATMVLVMVTGSACLYFGAEDSLESRYPQDIGISIKYRSSDSSDQIVADQMRTAADEIFEKEGIEPQKKIEYNVASIEGVLKDGTFDPNMISSLDIDAAENIYVAYFMSEEDYSDISGEEVNLGPDQAMVYTGKRDYDKKTLTLAGGKTLEVVRELDDFEYNGDMSMNAVSPIIIIVSDVEDVTAPFAKIQQDGFWLLRNSYYYGADIQQGTDEEIVLNEQISAEAGKIKEANSERVYSISSESREANREEFYGVYGGIFFLGIMLSIVFIFATTLIIYYKQISEGYEDQSRFEIMQKVGMTERNIKKSIRSQMLTVFFLPLAVAIIHLGFAFPMIKNLLLAFNLSNLPLLLTVAAVSVLIFIVFYILVYRITSNTYYHIVNGNRGR